MLLNNNLLNLESGGEHLLLVEDEAILALAESRMLEKYGFSVETVYTGEAAIEIIDKGIYPDLILMDMDLGDGCNGLEAAEIISSRYKFPIVFLTSYTFKEMADKNSEITRYGYIQKNSGEYAVISAIKTALEQSQKEFTINKEEKFLKIIEETERTGYWQIYPETSRIKFSEECKDIIGSDSDYFSFDVFDDLVLREYREYRAKAFRELVEYGKPYEMIYQIRDEKSDKLITVRSLGRKIQNMIIGILQDITVMVNSLSVPHKSEQLHNVIFRLNKDGVILADNAGRIVEMNEAAENLTGWDREESEGELVKNIINFDDVLLNQPVLNRTENIVSAGCIKDFVRDTVFVSKNGIKKHIAYNVSPIFNDNGQIRGTLTVFRDVTMEHREREKLKRNERIFSTIFFESHTPMLLIDLESGKIKEVNQAAEDFYGCNADELKNITIHNINPTDTTLAVNNVKNTVEGNYNKQIFSHHEEGGPAKNFQVISDQLIIDNKEYIFSLIFNFDDERILI